MDKKELTIITSEIVGNLQTILCNESIPTEYIIRCISDSVVSSKLIIWICNASKKVTVKVDVEHPHTSIDIQIGIKATNNSQHILRVFQSHGAPDTQSNCMIKGIVYDTSNIDYEGLIALEKESLNAQAHQRSKFLVMSENAQLRSVPSLQVHHNAVQCGHATTISYIDPIVIWYAAQRGLKSIAIEELVEKNFFL